MIGNDGEARRVRPGRPEAQDPQGRQEEAEEPGTGPGGDLVVVEKEARFETTDKLAGQKAE